MSDPNAGEWEKSKDSRTSVVGKQPGVKIGKTISDLLVSELFVLGSGFQLVDDVAKATNHGEHTVKSL